MKEKIEKVVLVIVNQHKLASAEHKHLWNKWAQILL